MIDKQVLQCQHCLSSLGCILGHGCLLAILFANKNVVGIYILTSWEVDLFIFFPTPKGSCETAPVIKLVCQ